MQFNPLEPTNERRYDAETLRQVTALAQQLQESQQDTLTSEQIEEIGEEAGLSRTFVRQALGQLAAHQARDAVRAARTSEFRSLAAGWSVGAVWTLLVCLLGAVAPGAAHLVALVSPPVLAAAVGFLIGKDRAATAAAAALSAALAIVFGLSAVSLPVWAAALAHFAVGGPLAVWLAWQGARLRRHYFPLDDEPSVVSPALLELLVTVQRRLQEQAVHRTFLSVQVAGAREMRRDASEPLAAHSFEQFQQWVEELVRKEGGESRGTTEEGLVCVFPGDAAAVRVARQIQEGMSRFNSERNRLGAPFRIRCGIAAGPVSPAPRQSLEVLQSPMADRAVEISRQAEPGDIVVTGDLAAAGLLELGTLAPLAREPGAEPLFSWRAGQRARHRP